MDRYDTVVSAGCMVNTSRTGFSANHANPFVMLFAPGSTEAFVCSDEEFSPAKDNVTLSCGQGLEETEVFFETVEVKEKNAYSNIKLTADKPVNTYIEKGGWFKISVAVQNPTDEDIEVGVIIDNVRAVRIE